MNIIENCSYCGTPFEKRSSYNVCEPCSAKNRQCLQELHEKLPLCIEEIDFFGLAKKVGRDSHQLQFSILDWLEKQPWEKLSDKQKGHCFFCESLLHTREQNNRACAPCIQELHSILTHHLSDEVTTPSAWPAKNKLFSVKKDNGFTEDLECIENKPVKLLRARAKQPEPGIPSDSPSSTTTHRLFIDFESDTQAVDSDVLSSSFTETSELFEDRPVDTAGLKRYSFKKYSNVE
jgi:hypothetical protein